MNPIKKNPEINLLLLDLSELNIEINSAEFAIENLSKSLSLYSKDSPAPKNPDQLELIITRKLKKFDTFIDLCNQESQKKLYLSSLLQESSKPLNQYQLPNSIMSEKFELSQKVLHIKEKISSLDSEILYYSSSLPSISIPTTQNQIQFLILILLIIFFYFYRPFNFFS